MAGIIDGTERFDAAIKAMPVLHIVTFHVVTPRLRPRNMEKSGDIAHADGGAYTAPQTQPL
jgi:hypothetical protein